MADFFILNMKIRKHFTHHTKSAIVINKRRKKYYSDLSNGKTNKISFWLIFFSYLLLPFCNFIDLKGRKLQKYDSNILRNDFRELTEISEYSQEILRKNIITIKSYKQIDNFRIKYIKKIRKNLKNNDLQKICFATKEFIELIEDTENKENCNLPMTKHLAESIGYQALHGITYAQKSNNKTLKLTKFLIRIHIWGLFNSMNLLDKKCQNFYKNGIGIVLNDVPTIPFLFEFEQHNNIKTT